MNNMNWRVLFVFVLLSGCGQPGPLYLPSDKPPVYVAPDAQPTTNEIEKNKVESQAESTKNNTQPEKP